MISEKEVLDKLKTTKEKVEWILRNYPEARNSDLYLTILYLRKFTKLGKYIDFIPFEEIICVIATRWHDDAHPTNMIEAVQPRSLILYAWHHFLFHSMHNLPALHNIKYLAFRLHKYCYSVCDFWHSLD